MKETTPYTYFIGWSSLKLYYYGVQYKKYCTPDDLFKKYFTSSKLVKQYIKNYGLPDIIQIRKTFSCKEKALLHEHKVLRRLNAKHRKDFLNKTNGRDWKQTSDGLIWIRNHIDPIKATKVKYIKNKDGIPNGWYLGFKSSEKRKESIRKWATGRKHNYETKIRMSEAQKGIKNHNYGKRISLETKRKISESTLGLKNHEFKGFWITPHGSFVTNKDAIKYSPHKISPDTLIKWCKTKNEKIITLNIYNLSKYLHSSFSKEECIGKSFKDIGFGFKSV